MEQVARGEFTVTLAPVEAGDVSRMTIAKRFEGDLSGSSTGHMLSAGNPATGSAGYVAIEFVTGTLAGRDGSFALQHNGTMDEGTDSLSIQIVPGSTGGDLAGLSGRMEIRREGGTHAYLFRYVLP